MGKTESVLLQKDFFIFVFFSTPFFEEIVLEKTSLHLWAEKFCFPHKILSKKGAEKKSVKKKTKIQKKNGKIFFQKNKTLVLDYGKTIFLQKINIFVKKKKASKKFVLKNGYFQFANKASLVMRTPPSPKYYAYFENNGFFLPYFFASKGEVSIYFNPPI